MNPTKKILMVWELGDGHGHVNRMLPIARGLAARGISCQFVVRWLQNGNQVVGEGFPVLQAPLILPKSEFPAQPPVAALSDIMETIGYCRPTELGAMIDGWTGLYDLVRPDLIVTDYSPTATLSARDRFPVVAIGDWFTLPPAHQPNFPELRPIGRRVPEATIVEHTNEALRQRGIRELKFLPEIFAADGNFIVTLPELDPYATLRRDTFTGALAELPDPIMHIKPTQDYFGYLSLGHKATEKVLTALVDSPWRGSLYLRDGTPAQRRTWRERGLTIYDEPQDLVEMARRSAAILHHGGLGTSEMMMALGRPQFFVPRHLEQVLNAQMIGSMKSAVGVRGNGLFEIDHVHQALGHLLTTPIFPERAAAKAEALQARGSANTLERIIEFCLTKLNTQA